MPLTGRCSHMGAPILCNLYTAYLHVDPATLELVVRQPQPHRVDRGSGAQVRPM
jgi:hypothetical protein